MKIALKRIWVIIQWVLIMIFAYYFLKYVVPIAFLIGLFKIFWKTKIGKGLDELGDDFYSVNFVLDKLGNVTVFNWLDFKTDRPNYGKPKETISEVLYMRERIGKLTFLDKLIYKLITVFDKDHFKIFDK